MPDAADTVKRIESSEGTRVVEFLRGTHGLFYFVKLIHGHDEYSDYWGLGECSGLYDSLEAAEREVRAVLPWLREQISN